MDVYQILCIVLGVVCLFQLLLFAFVNHKYSKTIKGLRGREVEGVDEKKGVRYSINQNVVDENGEQNISFGKEDVVLAMGQTEIVGKKNKVKPGKYTLLSSVEGEEHFNIRVGSFVKEYSHNQQIVLSDGEEITAVNTTVILR